MKFCYGHIAYSKICLFPYIEEISSIKCLNILLSSITGPSILYLFICILQIFIFSTQFGLRDNKIKAATSLIVAYMVITIINILVLYFGEKTCCLQVRHIEITDTCFTVIVAPLSIGFLPTSIYSLIKLDNLINVILVCMNCLNYLWIFLSCQLKLFRAKHKKDDDLNRLLSEMSFEKFKYETLL